jgi:carbon storage regulator
MLILTRKPGESLYIGDRIKVTIVESKGNQIRIGIDAPRETPIYREEIYLQILQENQRAASIGEEGDMQGLVEGWKTDNGPQRSEQKPRTLGVEVLKRRNRKKPGDV